MKRITALVLALVLLVCLAAGCGKKKEDNASGSSEVKKPVTIKVGASVTPHAEILGVAKELLTKEGYTLEIVEFNDYVLPNTSVEDGELDANYFQHRKYLADFNKENGTHLVEVVPVHYEPFGIYAGKTKSLEELADGAKIAVPNDGTNEGRALLLLEAQGLIKLKENVGFTATKLDIVENPKNLEIQELDAAQLVRALSDVDLAVINGNYAIQGGLNAGKDALAVEDKDSEATQTYANVLAVKEGHEKDAGILALAKALQSEEVKKFIEENYDGAVIPMF